MKRGAKTNHFVEASKNGQKKAKRDAMTNNDGDGLQRQKIGVWKTSLAFTHSS